jgi:hypothetical protein
MKIHLARAELLLADTQTARKLIDSFCNFLCRMRLKDVLAQNCLCRLWKKSRATEPPSEHVVVVLSRVKLTVRLQVRRCHGLQKAKQSMRVCVCMLMTKS